MQFLFPFKTSLFTKHFPSPKTRTKNRPSIFAAFGFLRDQRRCKWMRNASSSSTSCVSLPVSSPSFRLPVFNP
jgi:hypothetical protein